MRENWQNITHSGTCPSLDKLLLYFKGDLPKEESFALENHVASCEICNDVLEGIAELNDPETLVKIESGLKQRIHGLLSNYKTRRKIIPLYTRLLAVASILLIIGISIFLYNTIERPVKKISQNIPVKTKLSSKKDVAVIPVEKQLAPSTAISKKERKKPAVLNNSGTSEKGTMSEIQFDEGSEPSVASESAQITPRDSVVARPPLEAMKEEIRSESTDDKRKEKMARAQSKDIKVEYYKKSTGNLISGRVTDDKGMALAGVNVVIKGTMKGAITDIDGKFTLLSNDQNTQLQFSYVGYTQQELAINPENNKNVTIALHEDVQQLSEVVITGYGTQSKSDYSGSISAVNNFDTSSDKRNTLVQAIREHALDVEKEDKARITNQTDSLENILKTNPNDKKIIKSLIERYLLIPNKDEALNKLSDLYGQSQEDQRQIISEIINLTREEKYSKALSKLRKLK